MVASPRPDNSVGHQGLFFYRFDSGDTLSLNAIGLYYNRNRWYSPALGRFTSRDPVETAQLIVSAAVRNAQAFLILAGAFNDAGHFSNGMNLFQYANSNPVGNRDPGGLDWWDDEIDNQISDLTGNKLYALGMINDMSRNVGLGLRTALSVASALLPGAGLYDAFNSVVAIANGSGGFWDAINIAMAAIPAAKAASKLIGMSSLVKAMGYASRACNCFVAGTLVDTPWGARPIEEIEPGDEVMTCPQDEPGSPPRPGRVTRVFRNLAPVILWLSLSNGWEVGTTPGHEVWTYQDAWTHAGNLEAGDMFIGSDGRPVEVLAIRVDPTPTLVYNLEVDGTFTYYAAGVWVHNNSCEVGRQLLFHMHHALAKFLDGAEKGITVGLDAAMHQKYHGGLLSRLAASGIHKPRNQTWKKFFQKNEGMLQRAQNVMMDYTRQFDQAQGTSLLESVWRQIAGQYWGGS